jgi:hypothetical protein
MTKSLSVTLSEPQCFLARWRACLHADFLNDRAPQAICNRSTRFKWFRRVEATAVHPLIGKLC